MKNKPYNKMQLEYLCLTARLYGVLIPHIRDMRTYYLAALARYSKHEQLTFLENADEHVEVIEWAIETIEQLKSCNLKAHPIHASSDQE